MDALRTLQILISSRTPLIAIETLEEERVEQALERVAQRLRIPLFVWTMTRGLRRAGSLEPLYDTTEPLKALRNLGELPNEGIYLMKDLHRSLGDALVVRTLQDLTHLFSRDRRALVLTAPRVELPEHILEEIKATKPLSVTRAEDVEALREWARGRAVPAA
jgi:hypothetical protein